MTSGVAQIKRQQGVILLAFFAILFIAGAGVLISVLDSNAVAQRRNNNTSIAMREAKELLIAYATLYAVNYNTTNAANPGPGHLPCPDTNGDGIENSPCAATNPLGRLPQSIVLPNGNFFPLSDYNAELDEQFWYSVADNFKRDPLGVINSSTVSGTTLDGQGRIAAVLVAPGSANAAQSRPSNTGSRYLEDSNTTAPNFVSSTAVNPDLFNDRVLAITIDEIMVPVTRQVADLLKAELDAYHVANTWYPADQVEFDLVIAAPATLWLGANDWLAMSNYVRVNLNEATLTFDGCPNISYTVFYNLVDSPDDLRRIGLRC
ncbi:MAG: hypothetical protein COB20_00140 [SAR86 cluster bacterium]|uniref:Type II secretion system protein n=1 Tax=SAR86 cluster bacterium TaxID=2030880 RepID=A0A2A4XK02_9GAMM|nr:MAG: hypothetical protein COB20_00140 [SAR86 cluster bacterium]